MLESILKSFDRAYTYTSTFTTFDGFAVQFENVLLLRPSQDLIQIVNTWNQAAGHTYTINNQITIQEALELPNLLDRISLASRIEMIGDTAPYITHEYAFKYL